MIPKLNVSIIFIFTSKRILFLGLFLFSFESCLTLKVYNSMFPGEKNPKSEQIEKVEFLEPDIVKMHLKTFLFRKAVCIRLPMFEYHVNVYSYSFGECKGDPPKFREMKKSEIPAQNTLPVLDSKNYILDLGGIDKKSYYKYSVENLFDFSLESVYYYPEEHKIFLFGKNDMCMVLKRNEYGDKVGEYWAEFKWSIHKSECKVPENKKKLVEIKKQSNQDFLLVMDFSQKEKIHYLASGKSQLETSHNVYYLDIQGLVEETNYLYGVLFPFSIVLDVITSPLQLIGLIIYGQSLPPR